MPWASFPRDVQMTPIARNADAKLLYVSDPTEAFDALPARLSAMFEVHKIRIELRHGTGTDLAFDVAGLTLTVTHSAHALDLSDFATARRPDAGDRPEPETLYRLARHRTAIAVRVSGPAELANFWKLRIQILLSCANFHVGLRPCWLQRC